MEHSGKPGNIDLHAAATSWVAQELEASSSVGNLGYWVSAQLTGAGLRMIVMITDPDMERHTYGGGGWPPTEEMAREATRAVLGELGLLRRPPPELQLSLLS